MSTRHEPSAAFAIHHDLAINSSMEKVFEAVTNPAHLINWWPDKCTGRAAVGAVYNFYFTPEFNWYGEVIECVPSRAFHVRMTRSDADWDPTSFGFDLEKREGQVVLKFFHIGWPECNAHFRRSSYCWAMLLHGLKNYVEKGEIVPFAERE